MSEPVLQLCVLVVLLIGVAAFLLSFHITGDFLRDLLGPKTIRSVLRSVKRFRLRTLLGIVTVVQIFLAIALWQTSRPGGLPVCLVSSGCIFFVLWMIWACFVDVVDLRASSRLRRFGKTRRIAVPTGRERASTPSAGNESSEAVSSHSSKTR